MPTPAQMRLALALVLTLLLSAPAHAMYIEYQDSTWTMSSPMPGNGASAFAYDAAQSRLQIPDTTLLYSDNYNDIGQANAPEAFQAEVGAEAMRILGSATVKTLPLDKKLGSVKQPDRLGDASVGIVLRYKENEYTHLFLQPYRKLDSVYLRIVDTDGDGAPIREDSYRVDAPELKPLINKWAMLQTYSRQVLRDVTQIKVYSLEHPFESDKGERTLLGTITDKKAVEQIAKGIYQGRANEGCKCGTLVLMELVLADGSACDAYLKTSLHNGVYEIISGGRRVSVKKADMQPVLALLPEGL